MVFQRITIRPQQLGGEPCIRGLRIPVAVIVAMVKREMSVEEILDAYPDLEKEDILEALQFHVSKGPHETRPLMSGK